MSHLTKDQLRDAIESSGHDAPPTAARKEELISIYREKVGGREGGMAVVAGAKVHLKGESLLDTYLHR